MFGSEVLGELRGSFPFIHTHKNEDDLEIDKALIENFRKKIFL